MLDYLPVCSEDHSASMLRWDGLYSQKRSYSGGGIGNQEFFFFIPIFHITSLTPTPMVVRKAFFFAFSKNGVFNFGVCFFFSDFQIAIFNF